jgi:hypothetical protein
LPNLHTLNKEQGRGVLVKPAKKWHHKTRNSKDPTLQTPFSIQTIVMPPLSCTQPESASFDGTALGEKGPFFSSSKPTVSFAIKEDAIDDTSTCHTSRKTWYSKEELRAFKLESARSVQAILSGKHRLIPGFCERGLENMTKAGSLQVQSRRRYARNIVLEEQQAQRQERVCDPESIAVEYEEAASRSATLAVARGQSDAKNVEQ